MDDILTQFRKKAQRFDAEDPLKRFRHRFVIPPGTIYFDGNSLGLLSRDADASLRGVLQSWRECGIRGWLDADPPWFTLAETLGARCAGFVGAEPDEVVMSGTTTLNIHSLVNTFFRPEGRRTRIVADELDFPTDIYALKSVLRLHGLDPAEHLALIPSSDGRTLDEEAIFRAFDERTACVFLPSVLYGSGQLLDMELLTKKAREKDIPIGFDCSHSAGAVPHDLSRWGVDFALWCSYKYLNGGPGSTAFLYVNRRHFDKEPALAGWFGSVKERQFDMSLEFESARCAGGWQISSPSILSAAPLIGSLKIFEEAGLAGVREKSLKMTRFLIEMTDALLSNDPYGFSIGTPREDERRGGHVALVHPEGMRMAEALRTRGIISDFRPPDMLRIAPAALYNTFEEIWKLVSGLRKIVESREFERFSTVRKAIP